MQKVKRKTRSKKQLEDNNSIKSWKKFTYFITLCANTTWRVSPMKRPQRSKRHQHAVSSFSSAVRQMTVSDAAEKPKIFTVTLIYK